METTLWEARTLREGVERNIPANRGRPETEDGWMAVFFEFWAHVLRHWELRERFAAQHRRVIEPLPRLAELGVPRPSVGWRRVEALERLPAGKLQIVVAAPNGAE